MGAPDTRLADVSCPVAGACLTVGSYRYHLDQDTRYPRNSLGGVEVGWPTFQLTERISS
jgi:hypothetical protein